MKPKNKIVKNRPSPKNEDAYIDAYKEMNKVANKKDLLDISAVTTKNGEKGHALMNQSFNRSNDNNYHRGKDFISDRELKKRIKNKS